MEGKQKWKGGALLAPVPPTLVTCKSGEKENVFTVAWTGILNTVPPRTYISVRPTRFSHDLIAESGVFVINLPSCDMAKTVDSCGVYTGKKVDKFKKYNLKTENAEEIDCPVLVDCPVSLCCRVFDKIPLGSHDMFLADILSVYVKEELIDGDGKLHLEKANLLAYAHGDYLALGKKIGAFGYSVAKKKHKKG